jgi:hypothetical protein
VSPRANWDIAGHKLWTNEYGSDELLRLSYWSHDFQRMSARGKVGVVKGLSVNNDISHLDNGSDILVSDLFLGSDSRCL